MRGVCYGAHPLHPFRVFWIFSVVKPYFVFVRVLFLKIKRRRETTKRFQNLTTEREAEYTEEMQNPASANELWLGKLGCASPVDYLAFLRSFVLFCG